jgi:hypothetical protein
MTYPSFIITLAISAIHKLVADSAVFLHKFHATIRLFYNNPSFSDLLCNTDIELSYRMTEFMQKYSGNYYGFLNRRSKTANIMVLAK